MQGVPRGFWRGCMPHVPERIQRFFQKVTYGVSGPQVDFYGEALHRDPEVYEGLAVFVPGPARPFSGMDSWRIQTPGSLFCLLKGRTSPLGRSCSVVLSLFQKRPARGNQTTTFRAASSVFGTRVFQ